MPKQLMRLMPGEKSYRKIAGLKPWHLILTGNENTLEMESRCGFPVNSILKFLVQDYQHLTICRQPNRGSNSSLIVKHTATEIVFAQDFPRRFGEILDSRFGSVNLNVLMDITSLELDIVIHLQNYFKESGRAQSFFALYTSPLEYQGRENYKLRLNEIAQPPGYVSLHFDKACAYPHIFILGFDKGRALRFFDIYDEWKYDDIYVFIVHPPYVADGRKIAEQANKWVGRLNDEQIFQINAQEPFSIQKKLQELYDKKKRIDIIPLGPKPVLMGATRFYFSLSKEKRNNVRILYDFPQTEKGDTSKIGEHYLLDIHSE